MPSCGRKSATAGASLEGVKIYDDWSKMGEFENLKSLLYAWREGVKISNSQASRVSSKNPYGQAIYDLNTEWGALRRAHEEKIREDREAYEAKFKELTEASVNWKREYGPFSAGRGRPKNPDFTDEIKIAAARLYRSSNRTQVRSAMSIQDTATLTRVLTEGEALLKAQETEEDW